MTIANRINPRGSGLYLTFDSPSDFLATLGGRQNPCTAIFHPRYNPTSFVDPEGLSPAAGAAILFLIAVGLEAWDYFTGTSEAQRKWVQANDMQKVDGRMVSMGMVMEGTPRPIRVGLLTAPFVRPAFYKGPANLTGLSWREAMSVRGIRRVHRGRYYVPTHGGGDMNELAEAIRVAPGYKPGMHIQLGSCYGANDAAELAEITGVSVKANSGLVLGIYPLPFPIGFGDWSVAYPSWY